MARARFRAALAEALSLVKDLEADIGASPAELKKKEALKRKLDAALAPFRAVAASWAGRLMSGEGMVAVMGRFQGQLNAILVRPAAFGDIGRMHVFPIMNGDTEPMPFHQGHESMQFALRDFSACGLPACGGEEELTHLNRWKAAYDLIEESPRCRLTHEGPLGRGAQYDR